MNTFLSFPISRGQFFVIGCGQKPAAPAGGQSASSPSPAPTTTPAQLHHLEARPARSTPGNPTATPESTPSTSPEATPIGDSDTCCSTGDPGIHLGGNSGIYPSGNPGYYPERSNTFSEHHRAFAHLFPVGRQLRDSTHLEQPARQRIFSEL